MQSDFVAALPHNALLAVTGDDAAAFLHAQFTNDVQALGVGEAQWNGWCTPKGRLLATFLLVRVEEGFLLMLPAEIAASVAKRLGMFVLRSKVKIADVTGERVLFGIAGPAPAGAIPVAEGLAVLIAGKDAAIPATGTEEDWNRALINAGIPVIVAATQEAFVPQMANFELVGGVSFKKGCYPGQEIVARMQYRGGLKRRMALTHVAGIDRPAPGESVYSGAFGEQAAGTVVNAAPAPEGGYDALVVAQLESLARGDLRWKAPDGPRMDVRHYPPPAGAS